MIISSLALHQAGTRLVGLEVLRRGILFVPGPSALHFTLASHLPPSAFYRPAVVLRADKGSFAYRHDALLLGTFGELVGSKASW
jgi:hypothetical protein